MFLVIIGNNIRLGFHPHDLFFVYPQKVVAKATIFSAKN